MKHTIVAVALALSNLTFIASPVLAETEEGPNAVDVSQWYKQEAWVCFDNGIKQIAQTFSYANVPLIRIINRITTGDEVIYEDQIVRFEGESIFKAIYVKSEHTWIRYNEDEEEKINNALSALQKKFFPDKVSTIRCKK